MKYKLVEKDTPDDLTAAVEELIKDGWQLQGGVSVAAVAVVKPEGEIISAWKYHQAMIKEVAK